ncbi:hypothetical protein Bca4012_026560 [Brassica carinata]
MSGKRKRAALKPSRPASLPTQYEFVPRSSSQSFPPAQRKVTQPSVRDYPPPRQLFPTSTPGPSGTALPFQTQPRPSQSPPLAGAQSAPLQPPESPPLRASSSPQPRPSRSSEAQNSPISEDSDEFSDAEAPVEPHLAEDQMAILNAPLAQPGREKYTTFLSRNLEPRTTWFGYDKSRLSRKISKICRNKFDEPYYSWSLVPRERQERYFVEFVKKHTWHPSMTGLVQEHFETICQRRIKDLVSNVRTSRKKPRWINKDLWKVMTAYWDTEEAMAKSAIASAARLSDRNGLGVHKHNSGQKSYLQIEQEMVVELGRPVTFAEVFIKAHTSADGTFADLKAEKVVEAYKKNKQEKLANMETDNTDSSDGQHTPLSLEEDNDIFIQSTFTNDRGQIFGLGSLKNQLKGKPNDIGSFSSFMQMQQQLQEAQRQLQEQAVLIAKGEEERSRMAKAEEERSQVIAAQQLELNELRVVNKYMKATDPKYLAFLANETTTADPPQQ